MRFTRFLLTAALGAACLLPLGAQAAMDEEQFAGLCEKGTAEQVRQALKDGASPDARKYFYWGSMPALTLAAQAGNLPVVQVLLEALRAQGELVVDAADVDVGVTALMAAAGAGHAAVVEALLAAGADPKRKDIDGHDALWFAQNAGENVTKEAKAACVKLLQGGAKKPAAKAEEAGKGEKTEAQQAGDTAPGELRENPQGECLVVTSKNAALKDWRKDKGKVLERRGQGTILNLVADEDSHQGDWFKVYQIYENGGMAYLPLVLQGDSYFIHKKDVKRVSCPGE
ncbi:MAG: ankyrin repeat domain-containing protein [Ottowia sp.]|nr:ankyrin repeat domain-containing protein [Ottowia sp.]